MCGKTISNFTTKVIQYNNKCALSINHSKSVFEKQPSKEKINLTLAVLCRRVADSVHSIKFNNEYINISSKLVTQYVFIKVQNVWS